MDSFHSYTDSSSQSGATLLKTVKRQAPTTGEWLEFNRQTLLRQDWAAGLALSLQIILKTAGDLLEMQEKDQQESIPALFQREFVETGRVFLGYDLPALVLRYRKAPPTTQNAHNFFAAAESFYRIVEQYRESQERPGT